jgi:hypothetical protein
MDASICEHLTRRRSVLNALKKYRQYFRNMIVAVLLILLVVVKDGFTILRQFSSVTIRFGPPKMFLDNALTSY